MYHIQTSLLVHDARPDSCLIGKVLRLGEAVDEELYVPHSGSEDDTEPIQSIIVYNSRLLLSHEYVLTTVVAKHVMEHPVLKGETQVTVHIKVCLQVLVSTTAYVGGKNSHIKPFVAPEEDPCYLMNILQRCHSVAKLNCG